jgi:hypothetical protein
MTDYNDNMKAEAHDTLNGTRPVHNDCKLLRDPTEACTCDKAWHYWDGSEEGLVALVQALDAEGQRQYAADDSERYDPEKLYSGEEASLPEQGDMPMHNAYFGPSDKQDSAAANFNAYQPDHKLRGFWNAAEPLRMRTAEAQAEAQAFWDNEKKKAAAKGKRIDPHNGVAHRLKYYRNISS